MGINGTRTKEKILRETQTLVYENGFSGTSIDQILARVGITKGAFFYHFKSKLDLAMGLINLYAEEDKAELEHALKDTQPLEKDPLERLLGFIQWFIEVMADLETPHPGCLYASYSFEPNSFNPEIKQKVSDSILLWRMTFDQMLNAVAEKYNPKIEVDLISLADQFVVILEGTFIVSRVLNEADLPAKQLKHLKNYLELLFVAKI